MSTTSMFDNLKQSSSNMMNSVGEQVNNLKQNSTNMMNSVGDQATNLQNNVNGKLNEFSNTANVAVSGTTTTSFADSNGIIAKFGFFILAIICFLLALNLGIRLISYFMKPSSSIYIINGMIDGTSKKIILQNPKDKESKIIRRSDNEKTGIEFTWAVWLRLDGLPTTIIQQSIFVKGDETITNSPGVYFTGSNTLRIRMDTVSKPSYNLEASTSTSVIDISNIPIKKWFHVAIRCQNKYLDVYINGLVNYRTNLENVPLQNYDDVIVCNNGGFIGKLSNLIYYDYALNAVDINGLANAGPNLSDIDNLGAAGNVGSNYLSTLWYK